MYRWILTIFGDHHRGAMTTRLQVDNSARIVLGKVNQIVLEEIPAKKTKSDTILVMNLSTIRTRTQRLTSFLCWSRCFCRT